MTKKMPPSPRKEFNQVAAFGDTRTDPFRWMRDDNWQDLLKKPEILSPEIRAHLEAENAYAGDHINEFEHITEAIAEEMKSRIVPKESSVPQRDGAWEYWHEFREGGNYPTYLRRNLSDQTQQTLFDGDKESVGSSFFNLADIDHSPDQSLIAYTLDREGSEYFDIRIRNIETRQDYPEIIKNADDSFVWSKDSSQIYYIECDENHRSKWVKCHVLGTDPKHDILVYEESDDSFHMGIGKSQSGEYIFIQSRETDTSETRFLRSDSPPGTIPTVISPRNTGHRYSVEHHGNDFYICSNADNAINYKVMRTPVDKPGRENWVEVIPHNPAATITGLIPLKDFLVRKELCNALPRIIVSDYAGHEYTLKMEGDAYHVDISPGYMYDTDNLRVSYQTPANPGKIYDVNLRTQAETLRKERALPNGHNPDEYIVERKFITARDGAEIPMTILRHKSTKLDGSSPLYQYGYGSYGMGRPSNFIGSAVSLADRGVICAIAHIRGGNEKGRQWYLDGRLGTKQNTFNDFIDCAEALTNMGYGKKGEVVIEGGSAGGLLMGAVLNQRPDLFGGAIANVPFVDVMNTMTDATLPLTPGEWTEWGNPITDETAYRTMRAYSPYDNIRPGVPYPPVLAIAGLADFRVTYWEPAKWIARLRDEATGGPFLMKTNMNSGHQGSASRFGSLNERAEEIGFILHRFEQLGYDLTPRVVYKQASAPKPPDNAPAP